MSVRSMSFPGPVIVIPPGTKVVVCSFSNSGVHFFEENPGSTFVPFERSNRLILQDSMIVLFRDQNGRTYGHRIRERLEDGIIRVWMKNGKEKVFTCENSFACEFRLRDFKKEKKITAETFQSFLVQAETKEDLERIERFFEMLPLIEDYNAVDPLIGIPENPSDILRFIKPNAEIFNEIIFKNGKMTIMFYFWYQEQRSDLFFAVRNLSVNFPFDFDYRICQMTDDQDYVEDEKFHQRFTIPFSDTKVRKKDRSLLFFEGCWDFTDNFFLEITPKDDDVNVREIAKLYPRCEMISGSEDMKLFFMEIARKIEQTKS